MAILMSRRVGALWVCDLSAHIKKATLKFIVNFLWSIVRTRLSPAMAHTQLTLDLAVIITCLMVGHEFDSTNMLIVEINERGF